MVVELLEPIEPDEEPVLLELELGEVAPDELELGVLDVSLVLPEAPMELCFAK